MIGDRMWVAVMTQRSRMITPRADTSSIDFGVNLLASFRCGLWINDGSCCGDGTMLENTAVAFVARTSFEEDAWTIVVVLACLSFLALAFDVVLATFCNVGHNFGSGRVGAFAASGSAPSIFP